MGNHDFDFDEIVNTAIGGVSIAIILMILAICCVCGSIGFICYCCCKQCDECCNNRSNRNNQNNQNHQNMVQNTQNLQQIMPTNNLPQNYVNEYPQGPSHTKGTQVIPPSMNPYCSQAVSQPSSYYSRNDMLNPPKYTE